MNKQFITPEMKPLYRSWSNMKTRCTNPNYVDFHRYGGRGINYCDSWANFMNFYNDMKDSYSEDLTLDRINNDEGYSPNNCRWSTATEQARNRRTNLNITIAGRTKTLAEWIELSGVKSSTVRQRLYVYGWDIKKSLGMAG